MGERSFLADSDTIDLLAVLPHWAPAARIPCCVVSLADRLQGSIKAGSRFENRGLLSHAAKRLNFLDIEDLTEFEIDPADHAKCRVLIVRSLRSGAECCILLPTVITLNVRSSKLS